MAPPTKDKILIVEDEIGLNNLIQIKLSKEGYLTDYALTGNDAIAKLSKNTYSLLLLDYKLPDKNAKEIIEYVKKNDIHTNYIVITGHGDERIAVEMMKLGARDYLVKDNNFLELMPTIVHKAIDEYKKELKLLNAEAALKNNEEKLAVILKSMSDGIIAIDTDTNVILTNQVSERLLGYSHEAIIGKNLIEIFKIYNPRSKASIYKIIEQVISEKIVYTFNELNLITSGNNYERMISGSAAPICNDDDRIIGVVIAFRDITEEVKIEEELQKKRRLESLGILAGGIAHDFNNIITAILGNISLVMLKLNPREENYTTLQDAERAVRQAKDLAHQLLTFARGGSPIKKIASIADFIRESASFVLRGSNVECKFDIDTDIYPVEVDEGQINQVINNLIINADQAMPEGGIIDVTIKNITLENQKLIPLPDGAYVKITIEDHGIGIPEDHIQKIFDPYFTTKQKGNGLGLATCYSILKKHDGYITVESELGKYTAFNIYLPARKESKLPEKQIKNEVIKGTEHILVMDDEEIIRKVLSKMLKYLGYSVLFACDGKEAIECYKDAMAKNEFFDLVILDLTIPGGMGGKKCMNELRNIDPNVKGIVTSGYSNDPIIAEYSKFGFRAFIAKPFKLEELSSIVRKVLDN